MRQPIYILFHDPCPDGFTSAWVASTVLGEQPHIHYVPIAYGNPVPTIEDGSLVYLLDFSFPRNIITKLAEKNSLIILDHHKTAEENLRGLPYCVFDMNRSGAMLAWNHFFPRTSAPRLVEYIQDHDLWQHTLPHSETITAYIRSFPYVFAAWDKLRDILDTDFDGAVREGAALLRAQEVMVQKMAKEVQWLVIGGYRVPAVNATLFVSEVSRKLLEQHPKAPFAAYYFTRGDGKVQWGLRSKNFDVSKIAKQYGGGGHPHAAGFETEKGIII